MVGFMLLDEMYFVEGHACDVYVLACPHAGTLYHNNEWLSMHTSILRPVSGIYRIPGMLVA